MREIQLTQSKVALVSDEDYEHINSMNWWAEKGRNTWYALTWMNGKNMKMHRYLLSATNPKLPVDHIDGNGLNNQRNNLRLSTHGQNAANRSSKKKYKGVYFRASRNRWFAQCRKDGRNYEKAGCKTEIEAAIAYNTLAIKLHGEFAKLNII